MTLREAGAALGRRLRGLHQYVREVVGEADYDRYLARHAEHSGDEPPMCRREFERRRWRDRTSNPGSRCC